MTAWARLHGVAGDVGGLSIAGVGEPAERLPMSRERYGALRGAADRRDFGVEALEEASDGGVFVAAALMRGGR